MKLSSGCRDSLSERRAYCFLSTFAQLWMSKPATHSPWGDDDTSVAARLAVWSDGPRRPPRGGPGGGHYVEGRRCEPPAFNCRTVCDAPSAISFLPPTTYPGEPCPYPCAGRRRCPRAYLAPHGPRTRCPSSMTGRGPDRAGASHRDCPGRSRALRIGARRHHNARGRLGPSHVVTRRHRYHPIKGDVAVGRVAVGPQVEEDRPHSAGLGTVKLPAPGARELPYVARFSLDPHGGGLPGHPGAGRQVAEQQP